MLTLFISMIYIFARSWISSANPFCFWYIVENRGIFQSFHLTLVAFHPHEQARQARNLAKVGIFHPLHEQRIGVVGGHQRGAILG
jgi:hypothetical protein